jgi:hypothetical protein
LKDAPESFDKDLEVVSAVDGKDKRNPQVPKEPAFFTITSWLTVEAIMLS